MAKTIGISRVLQRRARPPKIETGPAVLPGIFVLEEEGTKRRIAARDLGSLIIAAEEYAVLDGAKKQASARQTVPGEALKQAAIDNPGFRGFVHEPGHFQIMMIPRYGIKWRSKLKQALGELYSAVVLEDITASVVVPPTLETENGKLSSEQVASGLTAGLVSLGISEEVAAGMITVATTQRVDEGKLAELSGRSIKLPANTADITETWAIRVDPLDKAS